MKVLILTVVFLATLPSLAGCDLFQEEQGLFSLSPSMREGFRIEIIGGVLTDIEGVKIHTKRILGFVKRAPFIIQDGVIYGMEYRDLAFVDHKNLSLNQPVQAAGYWQVKNGVIVDLVFESTYSEMTPSQYLFAIQFFKERRAI